MIDSIQQQLNEFECVLSMFPEDGELQFDAELKDAYEQYVSGARPSALLPAQRFAYTIRFKSLAIDGHIPELDIKCPHAYPTTAQVEFVVHCPMLARDVMEELQTALLVIATGNAAEPVVLQLYQCMADALADAATASEAKQSQREQWQPNVHVQIAPRVLGRRAIYFHHIIAATKRRVVKEWALELGLGGFSKIGWPGVVVVEGEEHAVQEYVRRLQHLRWQQMTVRGEQTEEITADTSLDELRRFPRGFCEFGESELSSAASLCREIGLEDLFLTVMKIYR